MTKKYTYQGIQLLILFLCIWVAVAYTFYRGLSLSFSETGMLFQLSYNSRHVALAGFVLGLIGVIYRLSLGSIFDRKKLPRNLVIIWGSLILVGSLLTVTLNEPGYSRFATGSILFLSGVLLPVLAYGTLGMFVNLQKD